MSQCSRVHGSAQRQFFSSCYPLKKLSSAGFVLGLMGFSAWSWAADTSVPPPGAFQPVIQQPVELKRQPEKLFEVPPVADRPLAVEEGPKVRVNHFDLRGAADHSSAGLSLAQMNAVLESARSAHPDGMTVGQMAEAANAVRDLYRKAGYPIAQAFIPAQDVRSGTVTVQVLEGTLGQIKVEKNKLYSEKQIQNAFSDLKGKTVRISSLETALIRVNNYPGLDIFGVLRPGDNVGDADLVLNAQKEEPYSFHLSADNYGVKSTGQERVIANAILNNLLGLADQLDLNILQTIDPREATYGGLNYEAQTGFPSIRVGGGINDNAYVVPPQSSALVKTSGTTTQGDLYLLKSWLQTRQIFVLSKFDLAVKRATVKDETSDVQVATDDLTVGSAALRVDYTDSFRGQNQFNVVWSQGILGLFGSKSGDANLQSSRQGGNGEFAGSNFSKWNVDYVRNQDMPWKSDLTLRANYQHATSLLVSLEQFSVGGPYSVRAYSQSKFLFDKGWFASAEWAFQAPFIREKEAFSGYKWGDLLHVSAFYDMGGGENNHLTSLERETHTGHGKVSGAGVGIEFRLPNTYFLKAEVAVPVGPRVPELPDTTNNRNTQYWVTTGLQF